MALGLYFIFELKLLLVKYELDIKLLSVKMFYELHAKLLLVKIFSTYNTIYRLHTK